MSTRSLLDYVQIIMEDMTSDSVNDIGDSLESQRVANILKRTYFDMAAEMNLPTADELFVLIALGDTDLPTHMKVPDEIQHVNWVKYDMKVDNVDTQIRYRDVDYLLPEVFFDMVSGRNSDDSFTQVVEDPTNLKLIIDINHNPRYWTSFDGEHIVFDSFDQGISSTTEVSKVACHGRATKGWTHENTAVPDLPDHMEATFLAIAEERCFAWIKQQENRVSIRNARRYRISGRSDKDRFGVGKAQYPNFGRPSGKISTRTRLGSNVK